MPTAVYKLSPAWKPDGNYPFRFVDDADGTFEIENFDRIRPLVEKWKEPMLQVIQGGESSDVCYCPTGYFLFNTRARNLLAPLTEACVEWLPVKIDGDREWIPHPLAALSLGNGADVELNKVSGNFTVIHRFRFAPSVDFFHQPSARVSSRTGRLRDAIGLRERQGCPIDHGGTHHRNQGRTPTVLTVAPGHRPKPPDSPSPARSVSPDLADRRSSRRCE